MAQKTYNNLITGITSTIKNNTNKSISGNTLQAVLVDIVDSTFGAFSGNSATNNGNLATGLTITYVDSLSASTKVNLFKKIIEIGDWNMDDTNQIGVVHGLTISKIREVNFIIRDDAGVYYSNLLSPLDGLTPTIEGGYIFEGGIISLTRLSGGFYDSTDYNSTSYNRGWITITYQE